MSWERHFGPTVNLDTPCTFPEPEVLTGKRVKLIPLQASHADELFKSIGGDQNAMLYDYMFYGPFSKIEPFRSQITTFANSTDPQFYAISDLQTSTLLGYASFLRIDITHRVIEIGHVMYSPTLQRTIAATELQYLLAGKAFRDGYRRLEWKCDSNNLASSRAAIRLGYSFEGIFRQHMIVKGRNRDSAWFSISDNEWPTRRKALEAWMDDGNFDEQGRQKKDLATLRQELGAEMAS
jgi:RimJ/RimL family protein N-acetyltransferase